MVLNMNKIKFISVGVLIFFLMGVVIRQIQISEEFNRKAVLIQESRKALEHLMFDIYQDKKGSFEGIAANGVWYQRVVLDRWGQGALKYHLRIRRQKQTPDILEVRIEAPNDLVPISNFKIRIRRNMPGKDSA